jgi:hypothetical protein
VNSHERRMLNQERRAPTIPVRVAYADAVRAGKHAARTSSLHPGGPLALLEASGSR